MKMCRIMRELRQTARTVLYDNADFQRLVDDLGATYPKQKKP